MQRPVDTLLWDIQDSCQAILEFTKNRTSQDYYTDRMLRSAVEREFSIIGAALDRIRKQAPDVAIKFPDIKLAIALRNAVIHGYEAVKDHQVWQTVTDDMPRLLSLATKIRAQLQH
jgi:uncharacterized protein with HEPN domain